VARGPKKTYIPLPDYFGRMNPAALKAALCEQKKQVILRSLIISERDERKRSPLGHQRTQRGFWYEPIKACLSRLGLFSVSDASTWNEDLSKALADLVKDGVLNYFDLSIVDGSRSRTTGDTYTLPIFAPLEVLNPCPHMVVFIEKAALYGVIEGTAEYFGVSSLCGGGSPSLAACEDLVRNIAASPAYSRGTPLTLLTLTDYDPSGYTIAQTARQHFELMAQRHLKVSVRSLRLGIEPHQLSPEALERSTYAPTDKGLEEWFKETGGVGGEKLGLELDALPLDTLRGLIVQGLEAAGYPFDAFRRQVRRTAARQLAWAELKAECEDLERKADILARGFEIWWSDIAERDVSEADLKRWAVQGHTRIFPLEDGIYGTLNLETRNTSNALVSGDR